MFPTRPPRITLSYTVKNSRKLRMEFQEQKGTKYLPMNYPHWTGIHPKTPTPNQMPK